MNGLLEGNQLRGGWLRWLVWGGALALWLAPWVAMRLQAEGVHWTALDFAVAGGLLLAACIGFEVAVRLARDNAYVVAMGIAVGLAFLTTWANLAVGIVGSEDDPVNQGFFLVLAFAFVAALAARFRPAGMALAMRLAAVAQLGFALWLWLAGHGQAWVFSGFACAAWLVSAELFARSRGR